jgi:uncharacterized membrane protein
MSWIPFALFSAIVLASRRIYEKNLTQKFGNFSMGFIVQSFSLIPTLVLFIFLPIPNDILHLPWQFWWPLLVIWIAIYPVQTYFMYRALREGDLSNVTPVMALLPVFNTVSSFVIIGDLPSAFGLLGILIIVIATYLLLTDKQSLVPGQKYNRAVLYMVLATACVAVGSTLDKVSIAASTPVFYSFMNSLGATIVFTALVFIYRQQSELKKIKGIVLPLVVLGVFQALSYTSSMFAFSLGQTPYVLAVRSSSFLFAAFLAIVFMKEKLSKQKILSFCLFILGIFFITVLK